MNEQKLEMLSALMDGELDGQIPREIINDRDLKQAWHRYHLISDALHQRYPLRHHPELTDRISLALRDEPLILAPVRKPVPRLLKPLAGLAVAASVAALAILGVQQTRVEQGDLTGTTPEIAGIETPSPAPVALPTYGVPIDVTRSPEVRPVDFNGPPNVRLNRYILNHNEYQSYMGVQGVTPHVRLVVTGSDE